METATAANQSDDCGPRLLPAASLLPWCELQAVHHLVNGNLPHGYLVSPSDWIPIRAACRYLDTTRQSGSPASLLGNDQGGEKWKNKDGGGGGGGSERSNKGDGGGGEKWKNKDGGGDWKQKNTGWYSSKTW